jgi:hypothetical protein
LLGDILVVRLEVVMAGRFGDEEIVEAFLYLMARYLVIRQEHVDLSEESVDYNVIKYNELGKAEFVNPNMDVAYLEAWLAVDEDTAVVLEVPRVEGRYYTAQVCDEWADIVVNINERNYPDHPFGEFAFCLAGTSPQIPEGAVRVDLPSRKAKMLARVERQGDDDTAVALQHGFKLRPLGEPDIQPAVDIPMFTNEAPITSAVFSKPTVEQVLDSAVDGLPGATEYQATVRGISDLVDGDASARAAVEQVIATRAWPGLIQWIKGFGDRRGGWSATTGRLTGFGDDIWFRAAANFGGIWWNNNQEVVYFIGEKDENNDDLNGDNVYVLHFGAGDTPDRHVNAYWSLTLMSLPDYRVVPNPLDRYSINNISPLQYEDDGSLKLYLGGTLPDGAPESNWLPAPDGRPFTLNHRYYVPKDDVLTGVWYVPPLTPL